MSARLSYTGVNVGDIYSDGHQFIPSSTYSVKKASASFTTKILFVDLPGPTANAATYSTDWSETVSTNTEITAYPIRYVVTFSVGVVLCVISVLFGIATQILNIGGPKSLGPLMLVFGLGLVTLALRRADSWKKGRRPK